VTKVILVLDLTQEKASFPSICDAANFLWFLHLWQQSVTWTVVQLYGHFLLECLFGHGQLETARETWKNRQNFKVYARGNVLSGDL